ncbi:TATE DNA Transposon, partial [Trypanosoma theileri]
VCGANLREPNTQAVLEGGDFASGKTSNLELDGIFTKYLPKHSVLPCDTLPRMTPQRATEIERLFQERGRQYLFFPIFIRHHWIAGIFSVAKNKKIILTIYDSAPSPMVQRDLIRAIRSWWPQIEIYNGEWVRQERFSEDCGIFVTAKFFATFLGVQLQNPQTLPNRLRPYLQEVAKSDDKPSVEEFHADMKRFLLDKNKGELLGGGENTTETASHVTDILQTYPSVSAEMHRRNLGYMWLASAMANLADGGSRSLILDTVAMRVRRHNFAPSQPHDIADAIVRLGFLV